MSSFGTSSFRYKGYRMTLIRTEPTSVQTRDGSYQKVDAGSLDPTDACNITLTCFPTLRGADPIKEFLNDVRGFANPDLKGMTNIYHAEKAGATHYWVCCTRPSRALEGVVMASKTKDSLVADIEFYLSDECKNYYENRGIPYRRGLLLYGPPGTGKTSFATAVAGHFKLPVYIVNLTELDDKGLEQLFMRLPRRCILMLEDVDSAGLDREYELPNSSNNNGSNNTTKVKSVTLSGLLNALDGPASVDGRVLFMTSNAPDSLDAALIRPGRCDRKVLFGYVDAEVSAKLFTNIYTRKANELYKNEQNAADIHDIPAMARQFAAKIPTDSAITPAECQAWLLSNRLDPVAALEGADAWAKEIIENKLRGANVASFKNEVRRIPEGYAPDSDDDSD